MTDQHGNSWRAAGLGAFAVAVLVALLIAAGILRVGGASETPQDRVARPTVTEAPPPPRPALPIAPQQPLARVELLRAFADAADAVANGCALPPGNAALAGREFAIRLPFGCNGPATDDKASWASWSYSPDARALKLQARPEQWGDAPWVRDLAGDMMFDAAEGFWLRRPWSRAEVCPTARENAAGRADDQSVGIVQFFSPDAPRAMRRGERPYAHTEKVAEPIGAERREYGLTIRGRIASFPDGQPIHCHAESVDKRPVCLLAATFERVAFTDRDGATLSEWRR